MIWDGHAVTSLMAIISAALAGDLDARGQALSCLQTAALRLAPPLWAGASSGSLASTIDTMAGWMASSGGRVLGPAIMDTLAALARSARPAPDSQNKCTETEQKRAELVKLLVRSLHTMHAANALVRRKPGGRQRTGGWIGKTLIRRTAAASFVPRTCTSDALGTGRTTLR